MKQRISVFWFRRDLRLDDNAGLFHALKSGSPVLPIFVFDRNILDQLETKADRRVEFIHSTLAALQQKLAQTGTSLEVFYGTPAEAFGRLIAKNDIAAVYTNIDYEPYARQRDEEVKKLLAAKNIPLHTYKDQVIFEKNEVLKDDGAPYTIFTPYSRKWRAQLTDFYLSSYPTKKYTRHFLPQSPNPIPSLSSMGFVAMEEPFPPATTKSELLKHYKEKRDYPGIHGTSRLGLHLRFGTISIRALARKAAEHSDTFLSESELIWRISIR